MEEGTPAETGPDGEVYFAPPVPKKSGCWPTVVAVLMGLVLVAVVIGYLAYRRVASRIEGYQQGRPTSSGPQGLVEFEPLYPSRALVDGLLDPPVELLHGVWWDPYFALLPGPEGIPDFLYGDSGTYEWRGTNVFQGLTHGKPFVTARSLGRLVVGGSTSAPYVGILDRSGKGEAQMVQGLSASGTTVWSWTGKDATFLKDLAPSFDEDGKVDGCVVGAGGADGIVGLGADGSTTWQRPKRHVVYEVSTHRALPGWSVSVGGRLELGRDDPLGPALDRGAGELLLAYGAEYAYADHVVLFPTSRGTPSVVWAGTTSFAKEEPTVARLDAGNERIPASGAEPIWRARPRTRTEALAMLEPPGRPRLFAVTTAGAELLLLDEDGTLRAEVRLPRPEAAGRTSTYALDAGPLGKDGWAIVVRLLKGTYVYRVHPEKLPPR